MARVYSSFAPFRDRRLISRSMASRMKSSLTSSSARSASIRSVVPSANGNWIRSVHCFLRPTRASVPCIRYSVKHHLFRVYDIDLITYTRYDFNQIHDMELKTMNNLTHISPRSRKALDILADGGRFVCRLERNSYTGREQFAYRLLKGASVYKGFGLSVFYELKAKGFLILAEAGTSVSTYYKLNAEAA